jgi:uncharacterized protein (TIGR02117 family)
MRNIFFYFLFFLLIPLFLFYLLLCLTLPLIKIGKKNKEKEEVEIYIVKDFIHSDFVFKSEDIKDIFKSNEKYLKIGWGDRKIFLETKSWSELKVENFLKAFFGLTKTVLRAEDLKELPEKYKTLKISKKQLEILKKYIKNSHTNIKIEKKEDYYQFGSYYESKLYYNCLATCNNWTNTGMKKMKISNRIWCPISLYI